VKDCPYHSKMKKKKILNNETSDRPDLIYSCKNWGLGNNNFIHRKQKVKLGSIFSHFHFLVYLFICYRFTPLKYGNNNIIIIKSSIIMIMIVIK